MVAYRVPTEWARLSVDLRGMGSLAGFKRVSRDGFLAEYGVSICAVRDCYVCVGEQRGAEVGGAEEEEVQEVGYL